MRVKKTDYSFGEITKWHRNTFVTGICTVLVLVMTVYLSSMTGSAPLIFLTTFGAILASLTLLSRESVFSAMTHWGIERHKALKEKAQKERLQQEKIAILELYLSLYSHLAYMADTAAYFFSEKNKAAKAGNEEIETYMRDRLNSIIPPIQDFKIMLGELKKMVKLPTPDVSKAVKQMKEILEINDLVKAEQPSDDDGADGASEAKNYDMSNLTGDSLDEISKYMLEVQRKWSEDGEN